MRSVPVVILALLTGITSVSAAPVTIGLTNVSQDSLVSVTALVKGDFVDAPVNVLAAPIIAGQPGNLVIEAAEGQCLYDLTFTFASGKSVARPDVDICQTDGIEVD